MRFFKKKKNQKDKEKTPKQVLPPPELLHNPSGSDFLPPPLFDTSAPRSTSLKDFTVSTLVNTVKSSVEPLIFEENETPQQNIDYAAFLQDIRFNLEWNKDLFICILNYSNTEDLLKRFILVCKQWMKIIYFQYPQKWRRLSASDIPKSSLLRYKEPSIRFFALKKFLCLPITSFIEEVHWYNTRKDTNYLVLNGKAAFELAQNLPNLQKLACFHEFTEDELDQILQHTPHLKSLKLASSVPFLSARVLHIIMNHITDLEELIFVSPTGTWQQVIESSCARVHLYKKYPHFKTEYEASTEAPYRLIYDPITSAN
jgi:hypothetical protein